MPASLFDVALALAEVVAEEVVEEEVIVELEAAVALLTLSAEVALLRIASG